MENKLCKVITKPLSDDEGEVPPYLIECLSKVGIGNDMKAYPHTKTGSFGQIYTILQLGRSPIILKEISMTYDESSINRWFKNIIKPAFAQVESKADTIRTLDTEVQIAYEMGKSEIGPKVSSAFYVVNEYVGVVSQYIFMEKFDGSLRSYFKKIYTQEELSIAGSVIVQMKALLKKQIFTEHLYCADIKPDNYVYKKQDQGILVKMIDFGHLCSKEPKTQEEQEDFYVLDLLQLFALTYRTIQDKNMIVSPNDLVIMITFQLV